MKKIIDITLLIISLAILGAVIAMTVSEIQEYQRLISLPSTSGVDFLSVHIGPVLIPPFVLAGIVTSFMGDKTTSVTHLKWIFKIITVLFLLAFFIALYMLIAR